MIFFRLPLYNVPVLSKTKVARQWGKLSEKRLQIQGPTQTADLCHVKIKKRKYREMPEQLSDTLESYFMEYLLEGK